MEKPRANGGILGNGLHGEKEAVRQKVLIWNSENQEQKRDFKSQPLRDLFYIP
jgi:hypothetical protein